MASHLKRPRSPDVPQADVTPAQSSTSESSQRSKKLKVLESYATSSPFPEFHRPTAAEAQEVFAILSKAHGTTDLVRESPLAANNSAQTCGSVPNVIESLIGTILSQNTSSHNSTNAKRSLDETFGRNNFAAIAEAPRSAVVEAIKSGGLANKKAATIQTILTEVKAKHGDYSLQHLAETSKDGQRMTDDAIMRELVSYDGVGPKTASCVLLFCMGRDSFAVDTHVFRLSRLLGWVPASADRILAQAHLDLMIPAELKYGLHVLMVRHGRACKGCKKAGRSNDSCILKTYLKERQPDKSSPITTSN